MGAGASKKPIIVAPSAKRDIYDTSRGEASEGAYQVIKLLGSGAEGEVFLVEDQSEKKWCLKVIRLPLPKNMVQTLIREILLQSELGEGHVNIIGAEEVVLTAHYLGLVLEWAPGGSLTDLVTSKYIERKGVGLMMPEDEVLYLFKQIVNAVDYMHRHQVAHRDLKLDNILLSPPYPPFQKNPPYIKLCDFGFAHGWDKSAAMSTVIGTPDYMAPQIFEASSPERGAQYDGAKADVWAMGVLLCVMLIGKFPFEGDSVSTMSIPDPVKQVWLQQNKRAWHQNALLQSQLTYLSSEAADLLDRMFELDENKRIDVAGIKAHPWFTKKMKVSFEDAIDKMEAEQASNERKVMAGTFNSRSRDKAVKNMIEMAASPEFRALAVSTPKKPSKFDILSRIQLRTVLEAYPMFDKQSMHVMISQRQRF